MLSVSFSMVNWMAGSIEFSCDRKLSAVVYLTIQKQSSMYRGNNLVFWGKFSRAVIAIFSITRFVVDLKKAVSTDCGL